MTDNNAIIGNLTNHYTYRVMTAFGNLDSGKALEVIGKSLNDIYRYFEPSFFKGTFYVCKELDDNPCFDVATATAIFDKNIFLNRTEGSMIVQVFNDPGKILMWENEDEVNLTNRTNVLIYKFHANREYFFANQTQIEFTEYQQGSLFAPQFMNLVQALGNYANKKIYRSSCGHFSSSWHDPNRLFFTGGGRGSNIPEKYMQKSLHEFLTSYFSRGISIDPIREYNVNGDQPKPVDVKVQWREANRVALIEVKFLGSVKPQSGGNTYTHGDPRANEGLTQLKGYHDSAAGDLPTTIIKSYLVVIDGRRNNLNDGAATISTVDGMHYKDVPIAIDDDKKFHQTVLGFEEPIKMFVTPICV